MLTVLAHGAYDARRCGDLERPALLILAPGPGDIGLACCSDVESLHLPPYVELLACGAACGPLRLGDAAASHLVGACMSAGARTVLASRIDLDLGLSLDLVEALHEHLRVFGESPASALLAARRKLAAQPGCGDPWYWAGLTLNGAGWVPVFEAQPRVERSSTSNIVFASAAATAIVAAVALLIRSAARRRAASQ
jgi:CHAT domain-containing protein